MKKVQNALPHSHSPQRKKVVVRALTASSDLIQQTRKASHCLQQCHIDTVLTFYYREDIARFMPEKQDVLTIWDENGDKHKEQKRILIMTIGEAYSLFVDENSVTIRKSKFAEPRPKEVLLSFKMPCDVCGCIYHEEWSCYSSNFTVYCITCFLYMARSLLHLVLVKSTARNA